MAVSVLRSRVSVGGPRVLRGVCGGGVFTPTHCRRTFATDVHSMRGPMWAYHPVPRLPLVPLEDTLKRWNHCLLFVTDLRYLEAVHPLVSSAEFENTR